MEKDGINVLNVMEKDTSLSPIHHAKRRNETLALHVNNAPTESSQLINLGNSNLAPSKLQSGSKNLAHVVVETLFTI